MKKTILLFLAVVSALLILMGLVASQSYAAPCTPGSGGGTGICNATSGQVLYLLQLTSSSPMSYTLVPTSSLGLSGGGGSSTVLYGVSPISVSALVNGNQTSSCPTCATTPGSTSTYLAVFDAANDIVGYVPLTYNSSTQTFAAATGTFTGGLSVGTTTVAATGTITVQNGIITCPSNTCKFNGNGGGVTWGTNSDLTISNSQGSVVKLSGNGQVALTNSTGLPITITLSPGSVTQVANVLIKGIIPTTTSTAMLILGNNSLGSGNANGTYFGVNVSSTFNGSVYHVEVNSTTILDLTPSGLVVSTGTFSNALKLSFLPGQNCIGTDGSGNVEAGTCPGGSGSGVPSTSPFTSGFVPYVTSTGAITNSNIFDQASTSFIGIGTTNPSQALEIDNGSIYLNAPGTAFNIISRGATSNFGGFQFDTASTPQWTLGLRNDGTNNIHFFEDASSTDRGIIYTNGTFAWAGPLIASGTFQAVGASTLATTSATDFTDSGLASALVLAGSGGHLSNYGGSSVNGGTNCLTSVTSSAVAALTGATTPCLTAAITSINGSTSSSQEIVSGNNELSVSTAGNTTTLTNLLIGSTSPTDYGLVSYGYDSAVSQGYSTAEDTFLGYYTGHTNSSGAFDTAVGGYSGADSAGSYNTGVGAEAVYGGAGSYNTGIGTYALSGNGNAIGSGNIGIGYAAGLYDTSSDQFYLDDVDQQNTTNEAAYDLFWGTFAGTKATTTGQNLWINTQNLYTPGNFSATGTVTAGNITNNGVKSALVLNNSSGNEGAYAGSSNPCAANQAPTTLSATGALGGCTSTFLTTSSVNTNNTLTGNGSASSPLGIASPMTVNVSTTIVTSTNIYAGNIQNAGVKSALVQDDSNGNETAYGGSAVNAGVSCLTSVTSSAVGALTGANTPCITTSTVNVNTPISGNGSAALPLGLNIGSYLTTSGGNLTVSSTLASSSPTFNIYQASSTNQSQGLQAFLVPSTFSIAKMECAEIAVATDTEDLYVASSISSLATVGAQIATSTACSSFSTSVTSFGTSTLYQGEYVVASTTATTGSPQWLVMGIYATKK